MAMVGKAISTIKASGLNGGDVMNGIMGIADYRAAREEGDSRGKATVKALASFAWGEIFYGGLTSLVGGPAAMVLSLAPAAASVASAAAQNGSKTRTKAWSNRGQFGSGSFNMSEAGYTMRQRSLNAIRSNKLNTQSVFGNEARTYFRGSV